MSGQDNNQRPKRDRRAVDRFDPCQEIQKTRGGRQEDLEDGDGIDNEAPITQKDKSPDQPENKSLFGKMLSYTPFGGGKRKTSPVSSSVSSAARRAEAEAEFEEKITENENEISKLEEDLEISEATVASLKLEIANKVIRLNVESALYEADKVPSLKKEVAVLSEQLSVNSAAHNRLGIQTRRKIERLRNEVKVLKKKHQVDIAHIDEDDEQNLGSDEDVDRDYEQVAKTIADFKFDIPPPEINHPGPPPSPTDSNNKALEMIAKTLEKLTEKNSNSSSTDKMIIRQTIGRDLPYFGGRAEEWPAFIASYKRTTEACGFSDAENLERLRKSLKGEALKSVECLLVSPNSLPEVMEALEQRFGQKEHIIRAMIAKARQIPHVKEDKPYTMVEFGSAVVNLTATIKTLGENHHLQNPILLTDLEEKLPAPVRAQWKEKLIESGQIGSLENFTDWVKVKARVAVLMTPPRVEDDKRTDRRTEQPRKKEAVFNATGSAPKEKDKDKSKVCNYCGKKNHWISECRYFADLTVDERWDQVKLWKACFKCLIKGHSKENCIKRKPCGVDGCTYDHHPLLHRQHGNVEKKHKAPSNNENRNADPEQTIGTTHFVHGKTSDKILMVVPVKIKGPRGVVTTHALLDNGSTLTLIDSDLANEIGSSGKETELCVQWIGSHTHSENKSQTLAIEIQGTFPYAKWHQMKDVQTVKDFHCSNQTIIVDELKKKFPHLRHVPLTDMVNIKPRILIGVNNNKLIVPQKSIVGKENSAAAHQTLLGWAVHGVMCGNKTNGSVMHLCNREEFEDIHRLVKDHFTVEAFGVKVPDYQPQKKEDERAQLILENTAKLIPGEKRYEIGLLYKEDNPSLVDSTQMAAHRLKCAERKMDRNPAAGAAHIEKIQEYIDQGYARKMNLNEVDENNPKNWYLPHFVIDKPHKPGKYRLVFDAAAKIYGKSLNDYLLTGPDLLTSLASVLIKFRQKKVAFSGDIRDMFHQVRVRSEDLPSQRFLWRGRDRDRKPDVYQMEVLVFGATSSPTSTIYVTHKNAEVHKDEFPDAADAIKNKHYMDDYLESKNTVNDAIQIIQDVTEVHTRGGFEITGWVSNSKELIDLIPEKHRGERMKNFDSDAENKIERILGLHWDTTEDNWTFPTNFNKVNNKVLDGEWAPSKREILGVVMSVFDPLGLLAHFTVKGKMILQAVWRAGYGWDDEIGGECFEAWKNWIQELKSVSNLKIPRCYTTFNTEICPIELHIFCDASELAYAAAAYLRVENGARIETSLVLAKSRVAPLKSISIPRMELMAAVMGARIAAVLKKELGIKISKTVYWSDNRTVLCWIRTADTRRYKQFVGHRIGEILETTEGSEWRWVPTRENVADEATRNTPADLTSSARWFTGPTFLHQPKGSWPVETNENSANDPSEEEEVKTGFLGLTVENQQYLPDPARFGFQKLLRITAYVLRFVLRVSRKRDPSKCQISGPIKPSELMEAEKVWWRKCQKDSFSFELNLLQQNVDLWKSKKANQSKLLRLSPILDEDGIIRLKGRIDKAVCVGWDTKRPVILDDQHPFVIRMIDYYHVINQHQGQEAVFNNLRRRYWILGMRAAVKKSWYRCNRCKITRAKPTYPEMGTLPACRLAAYEPPFTFTGLDYFGPVEVNVGRSVQKRWVALFVCMASRAIHVEIARRIDTDEAINAIRKFMSIRGQPVCIFSDNGTNFRGADGELKKAIRDWKHSEIEEFLAPKGVQWRFIPPQSPHFGGNWERMVKSVKTVLKNSMKCRTPSEEEFEVFVKEAANIVNSSPLSYVSTDADDPRSLTANDLLRPGSIVVETAGEFVEMDHIAKEKWRRAQIMVEHFWDRWMKECLPSKADRKKWHEKNESVRIGDVVIVIDDQLPRNRWPLGRIIKVHPGEDDQVRAVTVKIGGKEYKRPVVKICKLDFTDLEKTEMLFGGVHVPSRKQD